MLSLTEKGLYCARGDFYIDPCRSVDHAVITHAHSDHARKGSKQYYCVNSGVGLLKARLGATISVTSYAYQQTFHFKDVKISFHPAGHILGSSQVRLDCNGEVWVVSGDYKRGHDSSCEAFQSVPCDVFISEATFGTPAFTWDKEIDFGEIIFDWWQENANQGLNSVIVAYSLGKSQRILSSLYSHTDEEIYCHPHTQIINECYQTEGMRLVRNASLTNLNIQKTHKGKLFIVPASFFKTDDMGLLGRRYKTACATGWASQFQSNRYDECFQLSDHGDYDDLLNTILQTGAKKVFVQHRGDGALVKALRQRGINAQPDSALIPQNTDQMQLAL